MRKIISSILAFAMTASMFVTTAFADAGSISFTTTTNKTTFDEGKTVTVSVTIAGDPFCAFGVNLNYDKEIFTPVDGSVVNSTGSALGTSVVFGPADATGNLVLDGTINAQFATTSNNTATKPNPDYDEEDESMGPEFFDNLYKFQAKFKVNTNVKAGDYTFDIEPASDCKNAAGEVLTATYTDATVHVNGTKTDAPTVVEAKIAANDSIEGEKEVKEDGNTYFTKGLSATLTPGTETVINVIATFFNKAGNEGKEKAEWSGSYSGATPITFAVNVLNVPDGEDVTATWEIVK